MSLTLYFITDHISLTYCLYFLRYCALSVMELFVSQSVKSQILKLTLVLLPGHIST